MWRHVEDFDVTLEATDIALEDIDVTLEDIDVALEGTDADISFVGEVICQRVRLSWMETTMKWFYPRTSGVEVTSALPWVPSGEKVRQLVVIY